MEKMSPLGRGGKGVLYYQLSCIILLWYKFEITWWLFLSSSWMAVYTLHPSFPEVLLHWQASAVAWNKSSCKPLYLLLPIKARSGGRWSSPPFQVSQNSINVVFNVQSTEATIIMSAIQRAVWKRRQLCSVSDLCRSVIWLLKDEVARRVVDKI